MNIPDVIQAKKAELAKLNSFNVVQKVDYAPRNAEIMRTKWVVTQKIDNLNKSASTVKARLCTMGNSSTEFSKDSLQFKSPTCGRDTVKTILSLVPENKWTLGTFDVSSAFFSRGHVRKRCIHKDHRGPQLRQDL